MAGDVSTEMTEKNVPEKNKKRWVKGGSLEMKERLEKAKKTRKSLKAKKY